MLKAMTTDHGTTGPRDHGPRTTDPRRTGVPVRRLGRRHSPYQAVIGGSLDIQGGDADWDREQRSTFNLEGPPDHGTTDHGTTGPGSGGRCDGAAVDS